LAPAILLCRPAPAADAVQLKFGGHFINLNETGPCTPGRRTIEVPEPARLGIDIVTYTCPDGSRISGKLSLVVPSDDKMPTGSVDATGQFLELSGPIESVVSGSITWTTSDSDSAPFTGQFIAETANGNHADRSLVCVSPPDLKSNLAAGAPNGFSTEARCTWRKLAYSSSPTQPPIAYLSTISRLDVAAKNGNNRIPIELVITSAWKLSSELVLDEKIAVKETPMLIHVSGGSFPSDAAPEFLKADGSVDPEIRVSNARVVNGTLLEAEIFASASAALGSRDLRVTAGGKDLGRKAAALEVLSVELEWSQGAKTADNADRIANHPTVVRARISGSGRQPTFKGLLYVFSGGAQVPGSPFVPGAPEPKRLNPNGPDVLLDSYRTAPAATVEDKFFLRDTLNFYFGMDVPGSAPALPVGQYDAFLVLSPVDPAALPARLNLTREGLKAKRDQIAYEQLLTQYFRSTKPLRVLMVVDNRLDPATSAASIRALAGRQGLLDQYLKAAYPVDNTLLSSRVVTNLPKTVLDLDALKPWVHGETAALAWFFDVPVWANSVLAKLAQYLAGQNRLLPADQQFDRIALLLAGTEAGEMLGTGTTGMSDKATANIVVPDSPSTYAHELGHTFGFGETYCTSCYVTSVNPRGPNAFPVDANNSGNRVEEGAVRLLPMLDKLNRPMTAVSAGVQAAGGPGFALNYDRADMMGVQSGENDRWPDRLEWRHLYSLFRLPGGGEAGERQPLAATDVITLRGLIDVFDRVGHASVVRYTAPDAPPAPAAGDFTAELLDGSGNVLSSASFGVDFMQPEVGFTTVAPFAVTLPFSTTARQARIRKGSATVFTRAVSSSAPTVQVTAPSAGQSVSGAVTVAWNASDPDGDALTYTVYYAPSGGTLVAIAGGLTERSFSWDPSRYGGASAAQIVVVASDGVQEGKGSSGTFSVAKKAPNVLITSPANGAVYPAGVPITFAGNALDPEDGLLANGALSFRSSVDGALGTGSTVVRALSQGTHTITLLASDRDGTPGQATVTVTVGAAGAVPSIQTLSTGSGAPGTALTISGQGFESGSGNTVRFGTVAASVVSASATQIVTSVPSGVLPGPAAVTVTSRGIASAAVTFQVLAGKPRLFSVVPNAGEAGTVVTIRGAELGTTIAASTLRFGSTPATISFLEGGTLRATVPAGLATGATALTLATAQGTSEPLSFTVTSAGSAASPVAIASLSPASGSTGTAVTINGKGFSRSAASNAVIFGGVAATVRSATFETLETNVPAGLPSGPVAVVVRVNGIPSNAVTFTVGGGGGTTFTLSVARAGGGGGSVTSTPAGISCGAACSASFASGTGVSLTATPDAGSTFAGWSACSGTGACSVTMSADRQVTATFNRSGGGGCSGGGELMRDGGFEDGQAPSGDSGRSGVSGPWTWTSSAGLNPILPAAQSFRGAHAGAWCAAMNGYGEAETDTLTQDVALPAAVNATLSFYLAVDTQEEGLQAYDTLKVDVLDTNDRLLAALATFSNADAGHGYVLHTLDVSQFAGRTVRVKFTGVEDVGRATLFHLDDVSLVATCASSNPCPAGQCLRLSQARVAVTVDWRSQYSGQSGHALALPQDDQFGFFYFTSATNPEVFVKVLDFGSDRPFPIFYAGLTDLEYTVTFTVLSTGQSVSFLKPAGSYAGGGDSVTLRHARAGILADSVDTYADGDGLRLSSQHVSVSVTYRNQYTGQTGVGRALPQKDEFGYFYFTSPGNPELFVKVLDFGAASPYLLFYGGLTDFEYTVTFTNLATGQKATFTKPAGSYVGGGDNTALRH